MDQIDALRAGDGVDSRAPPSARPRRVTVADAMTPKGRAGATQRGKLAYTFARRGPSTLRHEAPMLSHVIIIVPVLLFSVIVHEISHGYVALRLGDPTAARLGRLTLNPLPHIDPVMTILLPAFLIISNAGIVFGGAKPVPINPYNLRNLRRDSAVIALAGPASNVVLALACWIVLLLMEALGLGGSPSTIDGAVGLVLGYGVFINIVLGWFNMLPIPPLDGSKVVAFLLSPENAARYLSIERYGFVVLIVFIMAGGVRFWMAPIPRLLSLMGLV